MYVRSPDALTRQTAQPQSLSALGRPSNLSIRRLVLTFLVAALAGLTMGCGAVESVTGASAVSRSRAGSDAELYVEEAYEEAPSIDYGEYEAADAAPKAQSPAGSSPGQWSAAQSERRLIFRADLDLEVEDPRAAAEDARKFVEARGGFLERMEVDGMDTDQTAFAVLRVPQEEYEATLDHLRDSAVEVLRDESARTDVTQEYVDIEARLTNLKAAETELRELMAEARETGGTTEDIITIYRELTNIRGDIEGLQAQLDALAEQVALSTIHVSFLPIPAGPAEVVDEWRPGQVFRDARTDLVRALRGLTDTGIYLVVAVLPVLVVLGVIFGLIIWLARGLRRRLGRDRTAQ